MDFLIEHNYNDEKNEWNVKISGEVDIFNADEMKKELLGLLKDKAIDLSIDCKDLIYMDSTGLGALVGVMKNVKLDGNSIYLKNVKTNIIKLFKITNLDQLFKIEGDING